MSIEVEYYTLLDETFDQLETFKGHYWKRKENGFQRQTEASEGVPDFVAFKETALYTKEGTVHYLGKNWAALYYLYTGHSDANWNLPDDGNVLNFAGLKPPLITPITVDPDEHSYLRHADLKLICSEMKAIDRDTLTSRFNPEAMISKKVYPRSWCADDLNSVLNSHDALLEYFEQCVRDNFGVLCWVCA